LPKILLMEPKGAKDLPLTIGPRGGAEDGTVKRIHAGTATKLRVVVEDAALDRLGLSYDEILFVGDFYTAF